MFLKFSLIYALLNCSSHKSSYYTVICGIQKLYGAAHKLMLFLYLFSLPPPMKYLRYEIFLSWNKFW